MVFAIFRQGYVVQVWTKMGGMREVLIPLAAELFVLFGGRSGVGERDVDAGLLGQLSSEFMVSDEGVGDLI